MGFSWHDVAGPMVQRAHVFASPPIGALQSPIRPRSANPDLASPQIPSMGIAFTPPSWNRESGQAVPHETPTYNTNSDFMDDVLLRRQSSHSGPILGFSKLTPVRHTRSSNESKDTTRVERHTSSSFPRDHGRQPSPHKTLKRPRGMQTHTASQRSTSCPSDSRLAWQPPALPSKNSTSLPSTPSRSFSPRALRVVPESPSAWQEFARPPVSSPSGELQESLVDVFLRVRPISLRERGEVMCICTEDNTVSAFDPSGLREYNFNFQGVIDDNLGTGTQEEVFSAIGHRAIQSTLAGFDTCIFASGQTGTGKTHTVVGTPGDPGLLPRMLNKLLEGGRRLCWISCIELYMDRVRDLLADQDQAERDSQVVPQINGSPKQGVRVSNLSSHHFEDFYSGMQLIDTASRNRSVARTGMNVSSSRGHVIFQITIETGTKLHLVDLAGRENEKSTGCVGQSLFELAYINRSLFHLTSVIDSLARQRMQVPFRNSKLTLLLSESLQSARMFLVATVSPAASCFNETLATLRHARSVRQIKTRSRRRLHVSSSPTRSRRGDSPLQERKPQQDREQPEVLWPRSESVSSWTTAASASSLSRTPRESAEPERRRPGMRSPEVRRRP
eukprot:TRINITY_DN58653_c0_g1_i1.p1 TRINITY_DN58653_c0_g1~~TRINITY_DN58653_c0_g1_i1.p1  ORF type:complete len:616 (+),score=50.64 TRINITY_DN58653_c0_g1_i1:42-1889(+)